MKKLMYAALSVLLLAMPLTARAGAEDDGELVFSGVFVYSFIQNAVPFSFGYHDVKYDNIGQVEPINPNLFNCKVVDVAKRPFNRSVVIPMHIRIGIYEFMVTGMSNGVFQQTDIKSIDFKAQLRTIPQSSFMYCRELTSVEFRGNSPHFIEAAAFYGCQKLDGIKFPAQLRYIGDNAFNQCSSLTEIYIPKDLEYLGAFAFCNCKSLRSLRFATGHFRIIPQECFRNCESLQEVEIPEGVGELGQDCFKYSGLKTVTLPSTLSVIGYGAFANTPIEKMVCKALTPPAVQGYNFSSADFARIKLYVPRQALEAYRTHPFWSNLHFIEAL